MAGHGEKLSRKKEQAVAALLAKPSIPEAAKTVGIGERTLWRWLKDDSFKSAYSEARAQIVQFVIAEIQNGLTDATKTLVEIIKNKKAPASARVSAAKAMIDIGVKAVFEEDLKQRIEAIEDILKNDEREKI